MTKRLTGEYEREHRFYRRVLLHHITSPLIYLLLIAALVTFLLREYIDTGVILAVVIINSVIGFIQEVKAEEGVRSLKKLVVAEARVVRDDHEQEVEAAGLVPGDLVLLTSGVKVPADLRMPSSPCFMPRRCNGYSERYLSQDQTG